MTKLQSLDLTRRIADVDARLAEYGALYNVVKNERGKYVSLIQASTQAAAEMREKVKILQTEVDILQNEARAKVRIILGNSGTGLPSTACQQSTSLLTFACRPKHSTPSGHLMQVPKFSVMHSGPS